MRYGAQVYNNGTEEILSPYESSVFYKRMRITPGVTRLFPRTDQSTPLIFIRAVSFTGVSLNGLCDVTVVNNYWCVDLKGDPGMPFDIYIFVKSSYYVSVFPQKWGIRIYNNGLLTHASSQRPLRILTGNNFNSQSGQADTGVPCAVLISTLGILGLQDDHGGKTVRITGCGAGNKAIWNSMIVAGQMSSTNIGSQYFYIDTREYI